jgi:hypothetical protein
LADVTGQGSAPETLDDFFEDLKLTPQQAEAIKAGLGTYATICPNGTIVVGAPCPIPPPLH